MNLTYPAIITYEDNVFYIGFPDFEKEFYNTYGDTFEEAVEMGKEYLVLLLEELENEKKEFPAPSKIKKVKELLEDKQELVYISLNYEYEKSLVKIAYVKKQFLVI